MADKVKVTITWGKGYRPDGEKPVTIKEFDTPEAAAVYLMSMKPLLDFSEAEYELDE